MTIPKNQYRKRRASTLTGIPRNILEWFSGERLFTFFAHTYPYQAHLGEYWEAWIEEHPKAVKPPMLDYLISSAMTPKKMKEKGGN